MQFLSLRKTLSILVIFGLFAGLSATAVAEDKKDDVETLKVDPVHSNVLFRVKHFDAGYFYGEFVDKKGTIKFDEDNPEKSEINLTVDAKSINTNNKKRDDHLKGPDFFNVKQHPEIKFESKKVKKSGDDLKVTGDLTLHGKTKEVTVDVEQTGSGKDPEGKFRRGFHTEFNIDRSDFGMDYMTKAASDEVKLIIALEAVRQ
ncbi:MAG: YceI family protein [Persicimonas sp.]